MSQFKAPTIPPGETDAEFLAQIEATHCRPLPDSDWTGGTLAYTAEQMRTYGLQERAAERLRMLDCRTCRHHTHASGGCMSVLECHEGSAYQRTMRRQLWK